MRRGSLLGVRSADGTGQAARDPAWSVRRLAGTVLAAFVAVGLANPLAAGSARDWVLMADRDGFALYYDSASLHRAGATVRFAMRIVPSEPAPGRPARFEAEQEIDCAGQTATIISARAFGAGGEVIRSMTVDPGRVRRDPLYAGTEHSELIYRLACPSGRPLPVSPPPPISVVPGSEPSRDCSGCSGDA